MSNSPESSRRALTNRARKALLFLAFLCFCLSVPAQDEYEGVERVVAVGDVHGGFEELVHVLRTARVIDSRNQWLGGPTHVVQTGDLLDRGPDSRKVMDLLMKLEPQAQKAGGRIHVLLGNHESMNLYGDLRYVSHEDFESYRSHNSERLRAEAFESLATPGQKEDREYRRKWEQDHPLGWVEHRKAFSQDGLYGRWLRQKNVVVKINNVVFVHAGIGPKYVSLSLKQINSSARAELMDFTKLKGGIVLDKEGPLWYRGLADAQEPDLTPHVDSVLNAYHVEHIVIAHAPTPGVILPRFGSKVIMIDVGISKIYGDVQACLVVEGGQLFALHRGSKLELPVGDDVLAYLRKALQLEPSDSPLYRHMNRTP